MFLRKGFLSLLCFVLKGHTYYVAQDGPKLLVQTILLPQLSSCHMASIPISYNLIWFKVQIFVVYIYKNLCLPSLTGLWTPWKLSTFPQFLSLSLSLPVCLCVHVFPPSHPQEFLWNSERSHVFQRACSLLLYRNCILIISMRVPLKLETLGGKGKVNF